MEAVTAGLSEVEVIYCSRIVEHMKNILQRLLRHSYGILAISLKMTPLKITYFCIVRLV